MRHGRIIWILLLIMMMTCPAVAQIKKTNLAVYVDLSEPETANTHWRRFLPGLNPDRDLTFRPSVPYVSLPMNTTMPLGDFFWMGSTTRQSYNEGKIGRTYYWDVQGNLRGSTLFIDIAGKGKRGLKLAFVRYRALY